MDIPHARVAGHQETSLIRMRIPFLLSNCPGIQETTDRAKVAGEKDGMDAFEQQKATSIMASQSLDSGSRFDRVERWVLSSSAHVTASDSGYTADSEDGITSSREQWSHKHFNDHTPVVSPPIEVTSLDYGYVDTDQIVLADTELIRPRAFTSRTSKRCRSPRLGYTPDEKMFIMHARVIGNMGWQDISMIFEKIFGKKDTKHTISGLRSMYYRTRGDWGMDYVTRSGPNQRQNDKMVVSMRLSKHAVSSHSNWVVG